MEYNLYCKCIIIITSISLLSALLNEECETLEATSSRGEIILEHGHDLEIFCTMKDNKTYNASSLKFFKNDEAVLQNYTHTINETTIRLFIKSPPLSKNIYKCAVQDVNIGERTVCSNVIIGTPPQDVKNFSCLFYNWEKMECTWVPPENFVDTVYSLYNNIEWNLYACPITHTRKNSCTWSIDSRPLYRQLKKSFTFILKGENVFGTRNYIYEYQHFKNVIPGKPVNLTFSNVTSDSLTITWTYPVGMGRFPPGLVYMVKYKSQLDPEDYWHVVDVSHLPKNSTPNTNYELTIKNLKYAFTLYDIRVYVRSGAGVEPYKWSDPATVTVHTAEIVPAEPPKTDMGSYEIVNSRVSHCDILIYWQQIPQYLENGANFSYKVYLFQNGIELKISPTDVTKSYARFKELPYNNYTFKIVSFNSQGNSSDASEIFVPSPEYRYNVPESFTKVDYDHGLYQLSWKPPAKNDRNSEEIESYTLFWCEDKKDRPFQCEGMLNWTRIPNNVTVKNITLNSNDDYIFQFAISANTKTTSSGMVWASCSLYPHEAAASGKMKNIWINKIGSHFMEVNWRLDCSYRIGIQQFIIRYCPIGPPQNNTCKEPEQNTTVTRNSDEDSSEIVRHNLTGLKPYTTYMINIAVITNDLKGQPSNALYNTTLEAAPDLPPQKVTILEVTNSSIALTWERPEPLNGVFQENKVFLSNNSVISVQQNMVNLTQLDSFTEYKISVATCTKACSPNSTVISVTTKVGYPEMMQVPNVALDITKLSVKWIPPVKKGGKLDYYEIRRELFEGGKLISEEFYNVTEQHFEIEASECKTARLKLSYKVSVRAVNIDNDKVFAGPWSPSSNDNCYHSSLGLYTIIILSFFGVLIFTFIVVGTCLCTRCVYKKCKNMQNIQISVSSKLTEISTVKEKEPCTHVAMHGWTSSQIQDSSSCNLPSPDQQLLLEKMVKEDLMESSVEENEDIVGDVDRESSGCGSGHGSVSSSINGGAQISSDSGTEADQRASSPDVFSDSPSRMCLLRQRNVSGSNNTNNGGGGEGYCRVAAPPATSSNYVAMPNVNRGYVMHSPPWTNTNQMAPSKGYVMAAPPLTSKPPASTYCVLGWKPSQTMDIPHKSNHECSFQEQNQMSRDITDSDGVTTDSQLDSTTATSSI